MSSPSSIWLRLEGAAALVGALVLYAGTEEGWLLFARLGFGLETSDDFRDTHLGRIGG